MQDINELKDIEKQLVDVNKELNIKVEEQTVINESLKVEMMDRKVKEDALRKSEENTGNLLKQQQKDIF